MSTETEGKEIRRISEHEEIERRFLVYELPPEIVTSLPTLERLEITQGYLASGIRLRKKVKKDGAIIYEKTQKTPLEGSRMEIEEIISEETYNTLFSTIKGKSLEKTRYLIPFGPSGEFIIELNVFKNQEFEGRMIAEVEFKSRNQAKSFVPPAWFGRDITTMSTNYMLAQGHPLPEK